MELEGNVLTHTSLYSPPPLLSFGTRPSYYLLLLFSELYKGPLRLWPFDGVEKGGCGGLLKNSRRDVEYVLKAGINGLVKRRPNENIKARLHDYLKRKQ